MNCTMNNDSESELEDGEIVEYTPLERPVSFATVPKIQDNKHTSDDEDISAHSDSGSDDSDTPSFRPKRTKMISKSCAPLEKPQAKKNKYNIWCSELQESSLTDNLVNIDVANKNLDRSRDVESYDYSLAYTLQDNSSEGANDDVSLPDQQPVFGNKRRFGERGSLKQRLGRKDSGSNNDNEKTAPRHLLALKFNVEDSDEDLAADIANKLCEEKEDLILRVVQVLGKQKAIDCFEKTRKVEEAGGLLIMNGRRRRTPGGSFLFLLKMNDDIPQEKKQKIFEEEVQQKKLKRRPRKKKITNNVKKTLPSEHLNDVNLPALLTRAEMVVSEAHDKDEVEECDAETTDKEDSTNPPPPPSPATDGRDNSSDGEDRTAQFSFRGRDFGSNRCTVSYDDDDVLDVHCNSMDMF